MVYSPSECARIKMDAKMASSNSSHFDEEKCSSIEERSQNAIVNADNRLENLENINSTSLKVLEKHSQLRKLNGELKKEKNEFKKKMEELEERWTIVQEKETIYRDSLIKFEKMLRDNDEKKLRALRKLVNERALQKTNEIELEILRKTNKQLLSQRQRLENKVANLRKYQRFLQELVKRSEYFSDIPEVLSRYNALMANLEDLKCVDQMNNLCFEELSTHLHQYREEKNDEKLSLTNELTSLRRRLEDSQTENRNMENLWVHARDNALQRVSELCEIKGLVYYVWHEFRYAVACSICIGLHEDMRNTAKTYLRRTLWINLK
ncbi:hypothetical protein CRM22_004893 [Opisthorchis felineus]|uniref:DUF4200 domain-containing protein n=1 Tax=Opisthorchis felineus TaxID=147828 RepID=A0A4S2LZF1_OPIFE|nr:hypothetical protein CRM22_004893 [Opisthorchis felineus]